MEDLPSKIEFKFLADVADFLGLLSTPPQHLKSFSSKNKDVFLFFKHPKKSRLFIKLKVKKSSLFSRQVCEKRHWSRRNAYLASSIFKVRPEGLLDRKE